MKNITKISILLLVLSMAIYCGKKEEVVEEETVEETAPKGSTTSPKIKQYEDFVTKFCALTTKMKTASATEAVQLTKDFVTESATLKTLQTDLKDVEAAADEAGKKRIKAATAKGEECAKSAAAGTSKPSADSLKKDIPKEIPKKIPGF
jgi:hypothetical protein